MQCHLQNHFESFGEPNEAFLDKLIHPLQACFIPDRQAKDNIILAQEIVDNIKGPRQKTEA